MGSKYELGFKLQAVRLYKQLLKDGFIKNQDTKEVINNVRDLVKLIDISSQTLYRWFESYGDSDELYEHGDSEKELKIKQKASKKAESEDFFSGDNEKDSRTGIKFPKEESDNIKFGIGWFMFVARNLGVKNYRKRIFVNKAEDNALVKDLKFRIGMKWIQESGLVDFSNKGNDIKKILGELKK